MNRAIPEIDPQPAFDHDKGLIRVFVIVPNEIPLQLDDLELIASDKSDACASGGTIVYGENCRSLRPHLAEYNRFRGVTALFVRDEIAIGGESVSTSGQRFDFKFGTYDFRFLEMSLLGAFQFNNAAIAIAMFLLWLQRVRPHEARAGIKSAVRPAVRDARWPGRLEVIQLEPLTVIDVGHTPDGVRQSLASLKEIYGTQGWILVTGVSSDKKAGEIVGALAPSFDTIICTTAHHKGAPADAIAAAAQNANPQAALHIAATVEDAVDISRELATTQNRKVYVAGGLFLGIEYATVMRGGRAQELKFF